ncbi:MAG: response regulator [Melioribacteraceae bacterium]
MTESKSKPRLLIVEDDLENQKFLKIFLRKTFEIDICDSAESFYKKLREIDFDVILMDISLKGSKDGLQLTKELRSDPKLCNIPIVILSAHAYQKDKDNAYKAGVDIFITKPVQGNILIDSLRNVLEQKSGIKLD